QRDKDSGCLRRHQGSAHSCRSCHADSQRYAPRGCCAAGRAGRQDRPGRRGTDNAECGWFNQSGQLIYRRTGAVTMKIRSLFTAAVLLTVMNLYGCGGGGGGSSTAHPEGSVTISGVAAMGPISGGDVKVYAVKDGKVDTSTVLGTGTTAADGSYTITLGSAPTGPVVVEVTGGTYTDEASGTSGVNNKMKLRAAVSSASDGAKIAVTTLTHLACSQVEGIGNFSAVEIDDANLQVGRFFEVSDIIGSLPFDPTLPAPAGVDNDQRKHSAALAVISFLMNSRKGSLSIEDAMVAVHNDLE